jgi:hypothetical protein
MANEFVAVTEVRHGDEDGKVTTFAPGDTVTGLDDDTLHGLWAAGSLTVKGSVHDPNTWVSTTGPYPTTPRVVEEALMAQSRELLGPLGNESDLYKGALTQPHEDAPEDPHSLLVSDGLEVPNSPADRASVVTQSDTVASPSTGVAPKKDEETKTPPASGAAKAKKE